MTTKFADTKLKSLRARLAAKQSELATVKEKLAAIAAKDEVSQKDLVERDNLKRRKKKLAGESEQLEALIASEERRLEVERDEASRTYLKEIGVRIAQTRNAILVRAAELENELAEQLKDYEQLLLDQDRAHRDIHGEPQVAPGLSWFRGRSGATALERVGLGLDQDRMVQRQARERMEQLERERAPAPPAKPDRLRALASAPGDSKATLEEKANARRRLQNERNAGIRAKEIAAEREILARDSEEDVDEDLDDESSADAGLHPGEEA